MQAALLASGQQAGHNYVMARTMLSEDGTDYYDEITYYDGYGYPYETVRKGAAGGGGNIAAVCGTTAAVGLPRSGCRWPSVRIT